MRLIIPIAILASFLSPLFSGEIKYEILDCRTPMAPKVIASGTKQQTPKDARVMKVPLISQVTTFIPLDKGFAIKISDPREKRLTGMGVSGWAENAFSWEWFDRDKGDTFLKLQEGGSIKVITKMIDTTEVIVSIEFLSDISIRLSESGGSGETLVRINIKKGSLISLIS